MSGWRSNAACQHAARLISLELDGELGRRERAVLARHLGCCPDCARLQETTATVTTILRLAPAQRPARPVVVPEQSTARRGRPPRGVAATLALAALAAAVAALLGLQQSPPATTSWTSVALAERVRLVEAELSLAPGLPLRDDLTTTPRPAEPFPACSLGCWPPVGA